MHVERECRCSTWFGLVFLMKLVHFIHYRLLLLLLHLDTHKGCLSALLHGKNFYITTHIQIPSAGCVGLLLCSTSMATTNWIPWWTLWGHANATETGASYSTSSSCKVPWTLMVPQWYFNMQYHRWYCGDQPSHSRENLDVQRQPLCIMLH